MFIGMDMRFRGRAATGRYLLCYLLEARCRDPKEVEQLSKSTWIFLHEVF